ncbi:MAG TPA: PQQ-binding-like beta-propeller repeat protein [Oligoflexus sp.]|uniref:outer membrane protein assembly factor BamB family protein n=1 Tax=Oligoflexus sp. TaxID=1971216 RepID=UPI002D7FE2B6|nr:PQQ-binding-like beta-propeller repeat protein [Oligoflexus sp.]HET9240997.1 PQQ-binding-like beta-propeller repeat protein [Oligoflexus sp.]
MKSLRLAPWILTLALPACTHTAADTPAAAPDANAPQATAAAVPEAVTGDQPASTAPVAGAAVEAGPSVPVATPSAKAPDVKAGTAPAAPAPQASVSTEAQPCLDVNTPTFTNCRPFRTGMIKMAPELDAQKPIGAIDESGWTMATDVLIGSVDPEWVSAYNLKSKSFVWWLKIPESMTAPADVYGSWAIIPLRDGRLLKVETQTGKQLWETRLSRFVTAKTTLSGNVLLAYSTDQKLYAIDFQTGQHLWVYDTGTTANLLLRAGAGPVVAGSEVIFGTTEGDVRSVSLNSGKENWKLDPSREDFRFKDVVGEIGMGNHQIYAARSDGLVFAVDILNKPNDVLWKETFPSVTASAYRDGTYVVGCINGDLIALQASTGRQLWKVNLGASIKTITIGEKAIFVGGSQGRITAVSGANGQILWHDDLQGVLTRQPIVVDDEIYFATGLKVLYSYKVM